MSVTKTWFGNRAAARGQQARGGRAAAGGQQLQHDFGGLGVIELEALRAHLLQVLDGVLGFQLLFLLGCNFILGRDPQHIAGLAHAQALGLQDDVQRLVPRHILQAQRDRPRD